MNLRYIVIIFLLITSCNTVSKSANPTGEKKQSKYDAIAAKEVERNIPKTFDTYVPISIEVDSHVVAKEIGFKGYRISHQFFINNQFGQKERRRMGILVTDNDSVFNSAID